jgi:hypothetical protein
MLCAIQYTRTWHFALEIVVRNAGSRGAVELESPGGVYAEDGGTPGILDSLSRNVIQDKADIVCRRFHRIDGEPIPVNWGSSPRIRPTKSHRTSRQPGLPRMRPSIRSRWMTSSEQIHSIRYQRAENRAAVSVPCRDLAIAHQSVIDRVLAEHQLPGDQRFQQPGPRGQVLGAIKLGQGGLERSHDPVRSERRSARPSAPLARPASTYQPGRPVKMITCACTSVASTRYAILGKTAHR